MHTIKRTDKGADITNTRGDSLYLEITLTKDGLPYIPEAGSQIRFAMKEKYTDTNTVLEIPVPLATMILHIEPEDTKPLPMGKTYVYDIELTTETGDVVTFYEGKFLVDKEVE